MQERVPTVQEYRIACIDFVQTILKYKRMYFNSLHELELILSGHAAAFQQLGAINREQSFSTCFSDWLRKQKKVSLSAGWAYAIEELLTEPGASSEERFSKLVADFFIAEWTPTGN